MNWDGVSPMKREQARRLVERIAFLRDPCDLDVLVFFVRHPRSLLTSDQIALYVGYDVKRTGDSLDTLLAANVLTRSQTPSHAARMYVFEMGGSNGDWLPALRDIVSTREGRLAIRAALIERRQETGGERDRLHRAS